MRTKALPGFRDFYPESMALRNHVMNAWRTVARRYGFQEYDGPPLEPLELYTAKSGEEIVNQLYVFTDRGGREVAMRPEMTPTLARMVGARVRAMRKPIRWFSVPQLFRYERQQRGRLREHFQLNMDLIGAPGPLADAEIMAAAIDVLRFLGFSADEFQCHVSDRRLTTAVLTRQCGLTEADIPAAFLALDKVRRSAKEAQALAETRFRADSGKRRAVQNLIAQVNDGDGAGRLWEAVADWDEAQHLRMTIEALERLGLGDYARVDLRIVRGLAYYTGPVFELFDRTVGLRAICGGGRYDGLLQALAGVDLPALGFGMGDVVLGELIREREKFDSSAAGPEVFLIYVTPDELPTVLDVAARLRGEGGAVEYALAFAPVRRQLESAGVRGAVWAIIIGPSEREAGICIVRNLVDRSEETLSLEDVAMHRLRGSGPESMT